MIPKLIKCDGCGYDIEVGTYRKFVKCPACEEKKTLVDLNIEK